MLQTVTSNKGRPPIGLHPLTAAERTARSRVGRQVAQLNVEVPVAVRDAVRNLAETTGRTPSQVLAAAIAAYLDSHK